MLSFDDTIDFEVCINCLYLFLDLSMELFGVPLYVSLFTFAKVHSGAHRKA